MSRNEESDKTVKRSNWDSLLPAAVRYDSRLKGEAKVLYSEILLLSNKAGYCYATDQHLAALFSKTRVTINGYPPILPSKNNFVKALRKKHPNITTVVLNVNDKKTRNIF